MIQHEHFPGKLHFFSIACLCTLMKSAASKLSALHGGTGNFRSVDWNGFHRWIGTLDNGDIIYFDDGAGLWDWIRVNTGNTAFLSDVAFGE
jgi:hypothetical protein